MTISDSNDARTCTLRAAALGARRRAIRSRLLALSVDVEESADGFRLRFADASAARDDIEAFIELERKCCAFLRFDITEDAVEGTLTLAVSGPDGARDLLRGVLTPDGGSPGAAVADRWVRSGIAVARPNRG